MVAHAPDMPGQQKAPIRFSGSASGRRAKARTRASREGGSPGLRGERISPPPT
jgi:hypothetical protein